MPWKHDPNPSATVEANMGVSRQVEALIQDLRFSLPVVTERTVLHDNGCVPSTAADWSPACNLQPAKDSGAHIRFEAQTVRAGPSNCDRSPIRGVVQV